MKNETTDQLQEKHPNAFLLLSQMARRTRHNDDEVTGLRRGECFIGDHRKAGLTMKEYRHAKNVLEKLKFAAFKGTNKGTIGTILNSSVYDVFRNQEGNHEGKQGASKGQARGKQGATNKKEEKEEIEITIENILCKKPKFTKPTFDELAAYCIERKNNINPQSFLDFYESKGWVVGKSAMKDWKAAVRTWERNSNGQQKKQGLPKTFGDSSYYGKSTEESELF